MKMKKDKENIQVYHLLGQVCVCVCVFVCVCVCVCVCLIFVLEFPPSSFDPSASGFLEFEFGKDQGPSFPKPKF